MCPALTTWGQVLDTRLLPLLLGWREASIWAPFVYGCLILMQTGLSRDTHGQLWKEPSMCGHILMPSPSLADVLGVQSAQWHRYLRGCWVADANFRVRVF